jgi:hypothetical protein
VFEGGDGSLLKTLRQPPSEQQQTQGDDTGSGFGWSSRAAGDLNGDCEPDYVAAAPFQNIDGIRDVGKTYFFLSGGPSACPAQVPQVPPPEPVLAPCPVEGTPGYLHYLGDEDTRPQFVRLRAAANRAELDVEEISLIGDRLSASGSVTDRAEGDVRLRFSARPAGRRHVARCGPATAAGPDTHSQRRQARATRLATARRRSVPMTASR